jgi:hypothetical protein
VAFALNSLEVELDEGLEGLPEGDPEAAGDGASHGAAPR